MTAKLAAALLAVSACSSAPAATKDFFDTCEPPRGLAKIQPGMSVADAKRLVPELREDHTGVRDELVLDSGVGDVRLELRLDGGAVGHIVAIVTGHHALALLTRAWGDPQASRDALGQHEVWWASDTTGWKAKLDSSEENDQVEFVPYHGAALSPEFFGAHVVPPGDLAKLRVGMTVTDAAKVAPGPVTVRAGLPMGYEGVRELVAVDDKLGTIRMIYLNLPQYTERVIEEAWGQGQQATELVGKDVLVWLDPATRWRATLKDALGYSHDLVFDNFMPAAQLFGDQPDRIDGLGAPVLGRSADDIKAAYKGDVTVTVPGRELVIALPPTEWEHTATRVTLELGGNAKVKQASFAITFKAHPAARDVLFELFTHKWGEPQKIEEDGKPVFLFHEQDPRIEVREDADRGAWRFELR